MQVFISHIHEEGPLGLILKDWIETTFIDKINVFVSSDSDDIPAGTRWLNQIEIVLGKTDLLLILCSPNSISRPWINFEAGCCWLKNIPIVPLCHSGLNKSTLPSPLSAFQALDILDAKFPRLFMSAIKKHAKIKRLPRIDYSSMHQELINSLDTMTSAIHVSHNERANNNTRSKKDLDENDVLAILQSWMGSRQRKENTKVIYYDEVDELLSLPSGTTKKYIEDVASQYDYVVSKKGKNTIIFKKAQKTRRVVRKSWLEM